ncbi:MAG: arylsulfatase [Limisphaerales bacterium]
MLRFAVAVALLLAAGSRIHADDRPNIIYVMADDLGYGDLGCFGQRHIKTPNLDRMAAEGMRLTSFYAGCTVCRPSRLSLWTGRHMGHTPIWSNARYLFENGEPTVAGILKESGYATGGIGKWAMGGVGTTGHPNANGFDFWMGYLDQGAAHNFYPTNLWRNQYVVAMPGNELMDHPQARGRVAKINKRKTYSHDVMTGEAFEFIRRHGKKPFLLHMHWTLPHANNEGGRVIGNGMEVPSYQPYAHRVEWPDTEKGQAAMIHRVDRDMGRLFKLLKELKIDEKTLVIFTSDNGPHSEGGHIHEFFDANGPLRGYKRDLYEGGIRVPTIARWPGRVKAGSASDEPLAFWDFMATACELAGTRPAKDTDGISFVPTLLGKNQKSHGHLFWRYQTKRALRKGKWKIVQTSPKKPAELYDLSQDIGEQNDLAKSRPELVLALTELMDQSVK